MFVQTISHTRTESDFWPVLWGRGVLDGHCSDISTVDIFNSCFYLFLLSILSVFIWLKCFCMYRLAQKLYCGMRWMGLEISERYEHRPAVLIMEMLQWQGCGRGWQFRGGWWPWQCWWWWGLVKTIYISPHPPPQWGGPHPPTNAQLSATPNLSPLALSISIVSQSCYLALC